MAGLWFRSALLPGGWAEKVRLTVDGSRIVRVQTAASAEVDDEQHGIALPGMPNLHSHAFQRAMAGLTEISGPTADSFWTWREMMYRFVDRLTPDDLEAVTAFAYAEMLEAGFTHVGEFHYLHHDFDGNRYTNPGELATRIVAAARETGIGLTLLPVFYAHGGFGGAPPGQGQRRFISDPDSYARVLEAGRRAGSSLEGAVVGVAPHSLRAVTPDELTEVLALSGGVGPVHMHVAEQVKEVENCLAWSGRRPVEWLMQHASVDERWCLVHATHMNAAETQGLARSGAVAGLCPITEANLGDGIFPASAFVQAGGAWGIGSDSNVLIDVAGELRALEYSQRLEHRRRNVLASSGQPSTGRSLYSAALSGGARALGCGEPALQEGAPADIVCLYADHPSLFARHGDALLDSWIFGSRSGVVDCVWRHGRKVVVEGVHVERDRVTAQYHRVLAKLLAG
jgi:formiminoglutamate deiminase